jgi:hypothetical protein
MLHAPLSSPPAPCGNPRNMCLFNATTGVSACGCAPGSYLSFSSPGLAPSCVACTVCDDFSTTLAPCTATSDARCLYGVSCAAVYTNIESSSYAAVMPHPLHNGTAGPALPILPPMSLNPVFENANVFGSPAAIVPPALIGHVGPSCVIRDGPLGGLVLTAMTGTTPGADFRIIAQVRVCCIGRVLLAAGHGPWDLAIMQLLSNVFLQVLDAKTGAVTGTMNIIGNGTDGSTLPSQGLTAGSHYNCSTAAASRFPGACTLPYFSRAALSNASSFGGAWPPRDTLLPLPSRILDLSCSADGYVAFSETVSSPVNVTRVWGFQLDPVSFPQALLSPVYVPSGSTFTTGLNPAGWGTGPNSPPFAPSVNSPARFALQLIASVPFMTTQVRKEIFYRWVGWMGAGRWGGGGGGG